MFSLMLTDYTYHILFVTQSVDGHLIWYWAFALWPVQQDTCMDIVSVRKSNSLNNA